VVPKLARQRVLQPSRQLEYGLPHASIFRRKDSTKTVRARSSRPAVQHRPPRPVVVEHGIVKIRDAVVGAGSRIMPGGKADDNDDQKDNQRNRHEAKRLKSRLRRLRRLGKLERTTGHLPAAEGARTDGAAARRPVDGFWAHFFPDI